MKAKLPSFTFVAAVILAVASSFFIKTAHAAPALSPSKAPANIRSLGLPLDRSGESVFRGTLVDANGVTALSSIDRKWDAPSGTGTLNEAAATPDGQVASRAANLVRRADGTIVARGTMTDFDGTSVNYTETLRRTPNGFVAQGTTSGLAGETSYETTVVFVGRNEVRRTTVTTKSDGTTSTHVETLKAARA